MRDNQAHGTLVTDVLSLSYAQHISLFDDKLKIIPSFQASAGSIQLDKKQINFGDIINARRGLVWNNPLTSPASKKTFFDLSSGLLINYNSFYFGTSVFHMNQPDEGLLGTSKMPYRLSFYSSYNFKLGDRSLLQVFARYERQKKFDALSLNANVLLAKHFVLGGGYASSNIINTNFGYRHNFFVVCFGYDVSVSKLSGNTAGSWDVQASFNIRNKEKRKELTDFERW